MKKPPETTADGASVSDVINDALDALRQQTIRQHRATVDRLVAELTALDDEALFARIEAQEKAIEALWEQADDAGDVVMPGIIIDVLLYVAIQRGLARASPREQALQGWIAHELKREVLH